MPSGSTWRSNLSSIALRAGAVRADGFSVFAQLMFAASFARKDFSVGASPLSGMVFLVQVVAHQGLVCAVLEQRKPCS
jgi:hypothetical protein